MVFQDNVNKLRGACILRHENIMCINVLPYIQMCYYFLLYTHAKMWILKLLVYILNSKTNKVKLKGTEARLMHLQMVSQD